MRLQGGTVQGSGRVEVCVDNLWGSVCDDFWTEASARVVCKQLGLSVFGEQMMNALSLVNHLNKMYTKVPVQYAALDMVKAVDQYT